tara:strand:+ start:426 stop:863 length:438 start_codon:yes stop_codon:yes gene_type:complete
MSEDKKTASVWDYDQEVIKNLQIHTSYIGGLQRITSKFILRSSEEDQLRLPETIDKFNKLVQHNHEKDGIPDIKLDEWESDLYVLFSLVQLLKFEANAQGYAKEINVDYDNSDMVELSKQVAQGKIDKDLAAKVDAIASKLKIVK